MKSSSGERIPMQLFIRRHDEWIEERVEGGEEWPLWREVHRDRLKDLQHERLIHLIVMMGFALLAFFSLSMWLFWGGIPLALLFLIVDSFDTLHLALLDAGKQRPTLDEHHC